MKYINNSHLKSHGLTPTQFKEMYPDVEAIPQEIREKNKKNSEKGKVSSKKSSTEQYNKRIESYNLNPKKCPNCLCIIPYDKRENKFCSNSCSSSLNNKIRKSKYSEEGLKSLQESAIKNHTIIFKNRKKGNSYKEKYCEICNNPFLIYWRTKNKKTCNEKCLKKYQSLHNAREGNIKTKFGYYKGIYCASSWELAFLIYNLDLGKNIQRCELTFSYVMEEEEKTYFPDFVMEEKIYEVKGRELEDVALKTQAVIDAGYQIELIRKKEITPIIKFLKEKYGVKDLTKLYDKKS